MPMPTHTHKPETAPINNAHLITHRDHLRSTMETLALPDPIYTAVMALLNAGDFALEAADVLVVDERDRPSLRFQSPEQAVSFTRSKLDEAEAALVEAAAGTPAGL